MWEFDFLCKFWKVLQTFFNIFKFLLSIEFLRFLADFFLLDVCFFYLSQVKKHYDQWSSTDHLDLGRLIFRFIPNKLNIPHVEP